MSKALTYKFKGLLTEKDEWITPAFVSVDHKGIITSISSEKPSVAEIEIVDGMAIPGFQNAHSHAFQYAMCGLAEMHPAGTNHDDFWSWRETMYKLALSISPDDYQAIATMLYSEMVRHGYTHIAEFHYLHHDVNGQPYNNSTEIGEQLCLAAQTAGIELTLIPIFYQKGGFGKEATEGQKRFLHKDADAYLRFLEETKATTKKYGFKAVPGFHSLRAVDAESMQEVANATKGETTHIHIAEQLKEIEDCQTFYGKRPVEWLLYHFEVDSNWHLVHATHLTDAEVAGIANSNAQVVLCPTTEGNLGDGIFPLRNYLSQNGAWSIGTDSHIGLDPKEELRLIDYGQRLTSHQRNTFVNQQSGHSAFNAIKQSWFGGQKAMGINPYSFFEVGNPFNAAVVNAKHPLIAAFGQNNWLSAYLYSGDSTAQLGTIVNGKWRWKQGENESHHKVQEHFTRVMKSLH
ncbi:MAG: formimidoylglutamate deiminase [Bacteroidetes bacterium]|nr:formimidoylglutamate deiminase [Bacteroidota bacterium]